MKKLLTAILTVLIGIISFASFAAATNFLFEDVEVDGVNVLGTSQTIFVERGDTIEVKVVFRADQLDDSVRVKAWIGGFEFGDVADRSEIFSVEPGITYVKRLDLEIPEDIEIEDRFTLHVEIFDDNDISREETFSLGIRKNRHEINVIDVIFYPSNTIEAGRPLRTVVRVENLGEKKEDDILVKVSIPELGISTRNFIDELVSEENTRDDDEETSASSNELILFIPKDAKSGEYTVEVDVEFNRGHDVVSTKKTILVEGVDTTVDSDSVSNIIVSVDMTSQTIARGSEVPYKFMIANLGNQRALFSVGVEGLSAWGTSRVSPSFVSVEEGQAGEFFVFVRSNEQAPAGQQVFRVSVLSNGQKIRELNLNANIVETTKKGTSFTDVQRGLEVAFVILVIVLIILGLIIAFRRVGQKSNSRGEPETIGNQTYY